MALKQVVCPHCGQKNRVPIERFAQNPHCGACHKPVLPNEPIAVNEAGFARHLAGDELPIVVDFWAPWCGPCQMMGPAFAQVATELSPKARFVKVNTEEQQGLANRYAIRSIPTLAVFKKGQEVGRTAGAMNANRIKAWIDPYL